MSTKRLTWNSNKHPRPKDIIEAMPIADRYIHMLYDGDFDIMPTFTGDYGDENYQQPKYRDLIAGLTFAHRNLVEAAVYQGIIAGLLSIHWVEDKP